MIRNYQTGASAPTLRDPKPSPEDHTLTSRLVEAGQVLGIPVLDHIIVGRETYMSFADEGLLNHGR